MIRSAVIQNFQSHRKTELEFSDGLNVIVGMTDSGKTAILRALKWLIWNRPGGDDFRSNWGGDTEVLLTLDDGTAISRSKSTGNNNYMLNDKLFSAFKTDVPEEIINALNLSEINAQYQFDRPFLLTATAGEVALHFNKIAHIDQIDSSRKKIESWIRAIEQNIASDTKQVLKNEESLKIYDNLEKLEAELEVLEEMEKSQIQFINSKNKLTKIINDIIVIEEDIIKQSAILKIEEEVDSILNMIAEKEKLEKESDTLQDLLDSISDLEENIDNQNNLLSLEDLVIPLLDDYVALEKLQREKGELSILIERLKTVEAHINVTVKLEIPKLQAKFDKEMGEVCILCDQPIKTHNHEKEK